MFQFCNLLVSGVFIKHAGIANYFLAYQISEKRVKTDWIKYYSIEKYLIFKFKLLLCIH